MSYHEDCIIQNSETNLFGNCINETEEGSCVSSSHCSSSND